MKFAKLIAIVLLSFTAAASAFAGGKPKPAATPLIEGYGDVVAMPQSTALPSRYHPHKVVFDLAEGGDNAKVNEGLVAVAQAVNAFAVSGVAKQNIKFVVVIHGAATPAVIDDGGYRTRYNHANPNTDLLGKLNQAGVQVLVGRQSLEADKITQDEVNSNVHVTLSAATDLVVYEEAKYVLVRL